MNTAATAAIAITTLIRFGLLSSRVVPGVRVAGSTVVRAVGRLISGVVNVWGRTLVSISLGSEAESNFAVPASPVNEPESLIDTTEYERVVSLNAVAFGAAFHWLVNRK